MDWAHVILTSLVCVGCAYGFGLVLPGLQPFADTIMKVIAILFGVALLFVFARALMTKGTKEGEDWQRISVILIVGVFSIVFWMGFEQAGGTLTLFADARTDRTPFGSMFPASS